MRTFVVSFIWTLISLGYALGEETEISKNSKAQVSVEVEIGADYYFYDQKTNQWIGDYFGPDFKGKIHIFDFFLGSSFRIATIRPSASLLIDGDFLDRNLDLNVYKIEYILGYGLSLGELGIILPVSIDLQPYAGVLSSGFVSFVDDKRNTKSLSSQMGGTIGLGTYFGVFGTRDVEARIGSTLSYNFVDLSSLNSTLGDSFWNFGVGIDLKGALIADWIKWGLPKARFEAGQDRPLPKGPEQPFLPGPIDPKK